MGTLIDGETVEPEGEGATSSEDKLDKVHDRARRRFDDSVTPQQEVRQHALIARRFIAIPGAMWDGPWGDQFANSIKVEVDKISKGVDKIVTDYRQNRIVPDFRPAGKQANQDTADTLDGIHRADSQHYKAQQARDNAFEEAVVGGFGAYRLVNEWADPYDKDSDEQRINPGLIIVDADQRVFFDPNSKLYDKSDARFAFVLTAKTKDAFEEEYPDSESSWPEGLVKSTYDWFTPEVVIVAEYYEVEDVDEKLLICTHPLTKEEERHWSSDLEHGELASMKAQGWKVKSQNRKRKRVHKYTMSGAEVLKDNGYIAGSCIPIVPVYGKRWFVDNVERFRGHVSKRMDSQRIYNGKVSKLAETDALAPREKPIFLAEQMPPNLQELWAAQETERHPYALVNPVIDPVTGQIAAMGPIGKVEAPSPSAVTAALLQIASNDLSDEDQNADEVKANVSEEAMALAATRVDAKSGIYLDNMRQSVEREGEIYLDMAKEVYFEKGRTVETMSEEGDDGEAVLSEPFTDKQGYHYIRNDFTSGKYKVIASVTEATATRRDKTVKRCLEAAEIAVNAGDMQGAQVLFATAMMNADGEGMGDVQKFYRKRLVTAGAAEPTDEEKQQLEQAQQQQQPDPQEMLAAAKAQDLGASAQLKSAQAQRIGAEIVELLSKAGLLQAQTQAVGGPEEAPEVPDGLAAAEKIVDIRHRLAETRHLETQTATKPHELAIEAENAATKRKIAFARDRKASAE